MPLDEFNAGIRTLSKYLSLSSRAGIRARSEEGDANHLPRH